MSETSAFDTPDLSTPFASALKMWRGEMERLFDASEKSLEATRAFSEKLLDEQARLLEAQRKAGEDAMRAFADGFTRLARAGFDQNGG